MTVNERYYRPIAPWTGRLVLPRPEERRPDGGVFIVVENAPDSHQSLLGRTCWLTWKKGTPFARIIAMETTDIIFTDEARRAGEEGKVLPLRLDGWRGVSPLESLAGIRPADDVQVMLRDVTAVYSPGQALIQIGEEPVQVTGERVALAVFLQPEDREMGRHLVRHYNPATERFDGPTETVLAGEIPALKKPPVPAASLAEIHGSPLNQQGWYLYGSSAGGTFTVKALEPRGLFLLKPTEYRYDLDSCMAYIDHDSWAGMKRGNYRIAHLDASVPERVTAGDQVMSSSLKEGDAGLVAHLFGWIGGDRGEGPDPRGIVSGHCSFGFAAVRRDAFTGELRWQIEYRQVYCHNPQGIAAGAHAWHSYMGSLRRGIMYLPPVSDTILLHPAFGFSYRFGTISFVPLREIEKELFRITAQTRSGAGSGITPIHMAQSCSQDSTMALHSLWHRMKLQCFSNGGILRWVKKNRATAQARMFNDLRRIVFRWDSRFTPFRIVPPRWKRYLRVRPYRRATGRIGEIIDAIITYRSVLPRGVHDDVSKIFIGHGAKLWVIRTDGIGGDIPGVEPLWPSTLSLRHPRPGAPAPAGETGEIDRAAEIRVPGLSDGNG
jgi:predicted Abi (CAAX) family protease